MAASKRQTTMAKLAREQSVRERRVRKQEKRDAKKLAKAQGTEPADGTEGFGATEDADPATGPADLDTP